MRIILKGHMHIGIFHSQFILIGEVFMALKDTVQTMRKLLSDLAKDLEKGFSGNKAASQRVRVNSIRFEKASKSFRKESVATERKSMKTPKSGAKKGGVKKTTAKVLKKKK